MMAPSSSDPPLTPRHRPPVADFTCVGTIAGKPSRRLLPVHAGSAGACPQLDWSAVGVDSVSDVEAPPAAVRVHTDQKSALAGPALFVSHCGPALLTASRESRRLSVNV